MQVSRWANRGRLPGRKIAGEWRFSRAEIHHWLEDRIGVSDEGALVQMEDVLEGPDRPARPEAISIAGMLPLEAIAIPLAARTRNSVITEMVALAAETCLLWDAPRMAEAVRARENLHPTALDNGVALLHPRRPMPSLLAQPLMALGRTSQGIPFGNQLGSLTDVFFLICSVEDRGHLRTLARLSRLIADPAFLPGLRALDDPRLVHPFIAESEAKLND
jgi:PTS system nitrogen regulatory IIA component